MGTCTARGQPQSKLWCAGGGRARGSTQGGEGTHLVGNFWSPLRSPGLLLLVEPEVEASSPPHMAMAAYADFEWSPPTRDLVADSMGV